MHTQIYSHTDNTYEHRVPDNEAQAHPPTHSLSLHTYIHTGKTYGHCVPDIEAQAHNHTLSLYTYIHTHTDKTYEHRVPDDEAQAWLDALIFTGKEVKVKASRSIFRKKYGHIAYSMMRAREADQEEGGGRRFY